MNAIIELVKSLGPLITAATPLVLGVLSWYLTSRQTRLLKQHSDDNREQIKGAVTSASGTYKALKPDGP